jgi:hypothetical protein
VPRAQLDVRGSAMFDGRVGIGYYGSSIEEPLAPLDVRGDYIQSSTFANGAVSTTARFGSSDGTLNVCSIKGSNGAETIALQTTLDNKTMEYNIENGWSYGTDARYDLCLQPYKGNVGIGTTTPAYTLDVVGNIYASGNIIMYSDARLKDNIRVIENALDKVCSLSGYTFTKRGETVHNTGVLAQEVLRVLPEVVHGSEETNYSVAYGNMVGILIEAIKELRAKNDVLQDIVSELCKK